MLKCAVVGEKDPLLGENLHIHAKMRRYWRKIPIKVKFAHAAIFISLICWAICVGFDQTNVCATDNNQRT